MGHNYTEIKWYVLSAQKSSQILHIELAFILHYNMGKQKADSIFLTSEHNEINSGIKMCFLMRIKRTEYIKLATCCIMVF